MQLLVLLMIHLHLHLQLGLPQLLQLVQQQLKRTILHCLSFHLQRELQWLQLLGLQLRPKRMSCHLQLGRPLQ